MRIAAPIAAALAVLCWFVPAEEPKPGAKPPAAADLLKAVFAVVDNPWELAAEPLKSAHRNDVIEALAWAGEERVLPLVANMIANGYPKDRTAALMSLSYVGGEKALSIAESALTDNRVEGYRSAMGQRSQ